MDEQLPLQKRDDNPAAVILVGGGEGELVSTEHVDSSMATWIHECVPPMATIHGPVQLWLHPVLRCEPLD